MFKVQSVGVEGLASDNRLIGIKAGGGIGGLGWRSAIGDLVERHGLAAVDGIGDDGMFNEGQMNSNLMGASGFGEAAEEGVAAILGFEMVLSDG